MQAETIRYSRNMIPAFFAGATRDDLKWTINYLVSLLDVHTEESTKIEMTVDEAREILSQRKLKNHNVPADFNGMRDEVNPKFL